jgi:hypothetical protein
MARFTIADGQQVRTVKAPIATATAIEAGDLVTLDTGLIIKAVAASTACAFAPIAHAANSGTEIEVTIGNDFTLRGTADANFAATDRGVVCTIDDTTQAIDLSDTGGTDLLRVGFGINSGTVGSASNVEVKIEKPLF